MQLPLIQLIALSEVVVLGRSPSKNTGEHAFFLQ